jgi:hypothetical protein
VNDLSQVHNPAEEDSFWRAKLCEALGMAAHNGYARQRYRTLARIAGLNARLTIMDRETAALGQNIAEQQEEVLTQRKARARRVRAGRAAMSDLGLVPRPGEDFDEERIEAQKRLAAQLQQFSEENSA